MTVGYKDSNSSPLADWLADLLGDPCGGLLFFPPSVRSGCLQAAHSKCSSLDETCRDHIVFMATEKMAPAVGFLFLFVDKLRSE